MSQPDESLRVPTPNPGPVDPRDDSVPVATVTVSATGARVVLSGEIDLASGAELDQAAKEAVGRQEPVEVDLSQVTFMDSTGVGFVATLITAGRRNGWRPRLIGPRQQVVETLTIAGVVDAVDLVTADG